MHSLALIAPIGARSRSAPTFTPRSSSSAVAGQGRSSGPSSERPRYFAELGAGVPGISDRLLSRRLRELEESGLVARSVQEGNPPRVSYSLTEKGHALEPALAALQDWARSWKLSS